MLYALGDPVSLLLLLLGFLLAVTLHGWVQSVLAVRTGDRRPVAERRTRPDPRRQIDPFGAVAAAIAGVGWSRPLDPPSRHRRGALVAVLLSGAVANAVLGLGLLAAFRAGGGLFEGASTDLLQGGIRGDDLLLRALLLVGLANLFTAGLSLVPLPPLPGGRLLFALAPRTVGWQKAEYQLDERNIGLAVVLGLLLVPLAGPPLLLFVLDTLVGPLADLVTGA